MDNHHQHLLHDGRSRRLVSGLGGRRGPTHTRLHGTHFAPWAWWQAVSPSSPRRCRCAYSKTSYEQSRDALEALDVNAANMGRLEPALIASAVTYLVLALVLFVMALWRSSVEASHDATGAAHSAGKKPSLLARMRMKRPCRVQWRACHGNGVIAQTCDTIPYACMHRKTCTAAAAAFATAPFAPNPHCAIPSCLQLSAA